MGVAIEESTITRTEGQPHDDVAELLDGALAALRRIAAGTGADDLSPDDPARDPTVIAAAMAFFRATATAMGRDFPQELEIHPTAEPARVRTGVDILRESEAWLKALGRHRGSQAALARKLGISSARLCRGLQIARLPDPIKGLILRDRLAPWIALELNKIPDGPRRWHLLNMAEQGKLHRHHLESAKVDEPIRSPVELRGPDEPPIIRGRPMPAPIPNAWYDVLQALVEGHSTGVTLDRVRLRQYSRRADPVRILQFMRKDPYLADVISFPGGKGQGGYALTPA